MRKVDLITGFLGSGKTTFLKRYADYLIRSGGNIGIIENDHGAVNVDMLLLQELLGTNCDLEMVTGGQAQQPQEMSCTYTLDGCNGEIDP